jgi:hypothetical protein
MAAGAENSQRSIAELVEPVANGEYIEKSQNLVPYLHACKSAWIETTPTYSPTTAVKAGIVAEVKGKK